MIQARRFVAYGSIQALRHSGTVGQLDLQDFLLCCLGDLLPPRRFHSWRPQLQTSRGVKQQAKGKKPQGKQGQKNQSLFFKQMERHTGGKIKTKVQPKEPLKGKSQELSKSTALSGGGRKKTEGRLLLPERWNQFHTSRDCGKRNPSTSEYSLPLERELKIRQTLSGSTSC
ncbi:UNVERIFIED_CONTAM: hypothetical protein K2H54_054003 [Gekko kuhli]